MSRFTRAAELAKKVLGTDRNLRNQEIKMDRMLPNRVQNLAETVLKTPSPRPGGLVDAARAVGRSDAVGMGAGAAILGGGAFALSQTNPSDLGKQMAQIDQPFYEIMKQVQEKASDLAQIPQVYFMQVKQAYDDERQRQQEMQNIQEFGDPMGAPVEVPPSIEEQAIKPVSVLMAQGGSANSGRTISNMDRAIAAGMGSPMYDDNEPRFEDRSSENQMFSIDTAIGNLMTEYDMVVRNQEFESK
tara:strand:+ start:99 stop:830 length:732 start_codon:yes stop_codon:yes gene_type:complete